MGLPVSKIKEIMKLSQETTSLDTTVDDDNVTRLSDLIKDESMEEPFELVFSMTLAGDPGPRTFQPVGTGS